MSKSRIWSWKWGAGSIPTVSNFDTATYVGGTYRYIYIYIWRGARSSFLIIISRGMTVYAYETQHLSVKMPWTAHPDPDICIVRLYCRHLSMMVSNLNVFDIVEAKQIHSQMKPFEQMPRLVSKCVASDKATCCCFQNQWWWQPPVFIRASSDMHACIHIYAYTSIRSRMIDKIIPRWICMIVIIIIIIIIIRRIDSISMSSLCFCFWWWWW